MSHRNRQFVHGAVSILTLALWLLMAAAEAWTPLHAWLHGGEIPDDDCPVAMIHHGKVDSATPAVAAVCLAFTPPRRARTSRLPVRKRPSLSLFLQWRLRARWFARIALANFARKGLSQAGTFSTKSPA
jgi:hypothetical protein